jgi:hypothetical protein
LDLELSLKDANDVSMNLTNQLHQMHEEVVTTDSSCKNCVIF